MPITKRLLTATAAIVLVLTGASAPATGAPAPDLTSGGNPPGGWVVPSDLYTTMFGGVGVGEPQGTVIADSGFRPYPHGFPIPNWGSAQDLASSSLVFGIPE